MTGITATDFEFVRQFVWKSSAIFLEEGKEYLAESRLGALAAREGIGTIGELVGRLRGGSGEGLRRKVIEAMTVNESSFFRDMNLFDMIKGEILPALVRGRGASRRLNLWSAACACGQEAYSLAILIREHFPELAAWSVGILATDLSTGAIEKARRGRYSQMEVGRGLSTALLLKYFHRDGLEWEARRELRAMIEFRPMNLVDSWAAIEPTDLLLLRNVLIYFDADSKRGMIDKAWRVLRSPGYLVLGGTELIPRDEDRFEPVTLGRALSYRRQVGAVQPRSAGPGRSSGVRP